jgi:alkylation response protein AidB-like acyl-CoA dehydrogenase
MSPNDTVASPVQAARASSIARAVDPPRSRAEALERARKLLPGIRERAERAEADRRLPEETIAELRAAGLFALATPKRYGGSELGFAGLVEVASALASACGSTGWVYGVLTGHAWMAALFPPEAQAEVFTEPQPLIAGVFRLSGTSVPVEGGYRLTGGSGRFCSGIDFSSWVLVGNPVQRPGAPPEPRYLLVPVKDLEIVDDWHTAGMRGTGSRSIRIADAFVPEHRTVLASVLMRGTSPGSLYHRGSRTYAVPFPIGLPFSLIGTPLGLARAALETLTESLTARFGAMPLEQAGEQGALFARVARAAAELEAAECLVLHHATHLETIDPAQMSALERARIIRDLAYAAQSCRYAVTRLFEAAGGSAIYASSPMQRILRDANTASAHTAFSWDEAATHFSRAHFGIAPSRFAGPRR